MSYMNSDYKHKSKIAFYLILFAMLIAFSYMFPHRLWAFSAITNYPLFFQILFWLAISSLSLSEVRRAIDSLANQIATIFFSQSKSTQYLILTLLALIAITIGFFDKNIILGDSYRVLKITRGEVAGDVILDHWLPAITVYKFVSRVFASTLRPFDSIAIIHILCAVVFANLAGWTASSLHNEPRRRLDSLVLILSSGTFLLFTHIEIYALTAVFSIWTIGLLISKLSDVARRFDFLIIAMIATVFHMMMGILFAYVFAIALTLMPFARRDGKYSDGLVAFAVLFPFLIAVYLLTNLNFGANISIFSIIDNPTYFLSFDHILMKTNYILFATPALIFAFGNIDSRNNQLLFILKWGAIISFVALIMFNLKLGALDFDLSSILLLPFIVYVAYRISLIYSKNIRATAIGVALLFFFANLFIGLSSNMEYKRSKQLLLEQSTPYLTESVNANRIRLTFNLTEQFSLFNRQEDYDRAIDAAYDLIDIDAKNYRGYAFLSDLHLAAKDYSKQESTLIVGIKHSHFKFRLIDRLASLYHDSDRIEKYEQLLFETPTLSDSILRIYEKPDRRKVSDINILIRSSIRTLRARIIDYSVEEDIFKWSIVYEDVPIDILMTTANEAPVIKLSSFIAYMPQTPQAIYPILQFISNENAPLKTRYAKLYIENNRLYIGTYLYGYYLTRFEMVEAIYQVKAYQKSVFKKLGNRFGFSETKN